MTTMTREQLQRMRAHARIERDTILEHMMREGRDPADAITEVPSVDEFVVMALRDEMLEDRGQLAEFALARLAARSAGPEAAEHRRNADRAEFELLREIAADAPDLTTAVWSMSGRLSVDDPPPPTD